MNYNKDFKDLQDLYIKESISWIKFLIMASLALIASMSFFNGEILLQNVIFRLMLLCSAIFLMCTILFGFLAYCQSLKFLCDIRDFLLSLEDHSPLDLKSLSCKKQVPQSQIIELGSLKIERYRNIEKYMFLSGVTLYLLFALLNVCSTCGFLPVFKSFIVNLSHSE